MKKHGINFQQVTEEEFDRLLRDESHSGQPRTASAGRESMHGETTIPQKWKDIVREYCEHEPLNDLDACLILLDAIADPAITCESFIPLVETLDERRPQGSRSCDELLRQMENEGYIEQDMLPIAVKSMKPNCHLTKRGWELVGHRK